MKIPDKKKILLTTKYFLISFIILFFVTFSVLFAIERHLQNIKYVEIATHEERIVNLEKTFLNNELNTVLADLFFIKNAYSYELENPENHQAIAFDWQQFSTMRKLYDQIRFIDTDGNEIIRIDYKMDHGVIINTSELQNKVHRYYFTETINLNENEFYISPMDLNIELSEIELPYKPIVRFATPVYDSQGNKMGIIIINYLAEYMLNGFRTLSHDSFGELSFVNADGYWLSSENEALEWLFMFEDQEQVVFQDQYTDEWKHIINEDGQLGTDTGLFTFAKINAYQAETINNAIMQPCQASLANGNWYIVSIIPHNEANNDLFIDHPFELLMDIICSNPMYLIQIIFLSGFISGFIYLNRRSFNEIKYYSEYDGLTNVYNRRAGLSRLQKLFSDLDQRRHYVSLCFIDINYLKKVNDTYGHKIGDDLIITTVQIIKSAIREEDFMIRMGGDEFLIVLRNATESQAEEVWTRIGTLISDFNQSKQKPYTISVSHGIVLKENSDKQPIDAIIKLADEKMYEEKRKMKENKQALS